MYSEEELRSLSPAQRREMRCALARLEDSEPAATPGGNRRRAIGLACIIFCCVVVAIWIGVLAVKLPRYYRVGGWRGAWVGFDLALLAAFAATGWAAWRRRQVLLICLVVLATLLCCDAWFDVVLDARTKGFEYSLLTAVLIELPLAAFAIWRARQLLRLTVGRIRLFEGKPGPVPPLRKVPMLGAESGAPLYDLFTADPDGDPGGQQAAQDGRSPARRSARTQDRGAGR